MSNSSQSLRTDVLLVTEVANFSGFPSNSDDTDWNWTLPSQTDQSTVMGN